MDVSSSTEPEYIYYFARDIFIRQENKVCDFLNSIKKPHIESADAIIKFGVDIIYAFTKAKSNDNPIISLEGLHQEDEPLEAVYMYAFAARAINTFAFGLLKETSKANISVSEGITFCKAAIELSILAQFHLGAAIGANDALGKPTMSLDEARSIISKHSLDIRHAENRQIREYGFAWLEINRNNYKTGDDATDALRKIIPFKHDATRKIVTAFDKKNKKRKEEA